MFDVRFLPEPALRAGAAAADRQGSRRSPRSSQRQPATRELHQEADRRCCKLAGAALRAGREELPDGRDRLHRRPASLGLRRRSARSASSPAARACTARVRASRPRAGRAAHDWRRRRHARPARHRAASTPPRPSSAICRIRRGVDRLARGRAGRARRDRRGDRARSAARRACCIVTDMFGGTPSNLGITFLEAGQVEVVTGVNLPMLIKLASLQDTSSLLDVARADRASTAATRSGSPRICCGGEPGTAQDAVMTTRMRDHRESSSGCTRGRRREFVQLAGALPVADPGQPRRPARWTARASWASCCWPRRAAPSITISADGTDEADAARRAVPRWSKPASERTRGTPDRHRRLAGHRRRPRRRSSRSAPR